MSKTVKTNIWWVVATILLVAGIVTIGTHENCQPMFPETIDNPSESCGNPSIPADTGTFESLDSHNIMLSRQSEAASNLSSPAGRTDPLYALGDSIPRELRPPREGETDSDAILGILMQLDAEKLLDDVKIVVWSVMQIGQNKFANLTINGEPYTVQEGEGVVVYNGVNVYVASVHEEQVIISLFVFDENVPSKIKTYIPKT